ncbi:luciferase family protein [Paenibacillus sp. GCM10027629]
MTLSVKQIISEQLLTWSDVTQQPHRFGGIEFLYQGKEI